MRKLCFTGIKSIQKWFNRLLSEDAGKDVRDNVIVTPDAPEPEPTGIHVDNDMPAFLKEADLTVFRQESSVESKSGIGKAESGRFGKQSLLDNKPLVTMCCACADAVNDINSKAGHFKSDDSQLLIELMNDRMRTAFYLAGATPIDKDRFFDPVRHFCPEHPLAENGTAIEKFIEPGVSLEDRVLIKARVSL